jgi:hypothetical protein
LRAFIHHTTFFIAAALVLYGGHAVSQTGETEPNLKAAYIYNFTRYISWEAGHEEPDFIIGEMGHSGLDSALGTIARNYLVNNHRIVLRHYSSPEDIDYCHILFIPAKCGFPVRSILAKAGQGNIDHRRAKGLCAGRGGVEFRTGEREAEVRGQ